MLGGLAAWQNRRGKEEQASRKKNRQAEQGIIIAVNHTPNHLVKGKNRRPPGISPTKKL